MNQATDLISLFALTTRMLKVRSVAMLRQLYQCYAVHSMYKSLGFILFSPTFPLFSLILHYIVFSEFHKVFQIPFGQSYGRHSIPTLSVVGQDSFFYLTMDPQHSAKNPIYMH